MLDGTERDLQIELARKAAALEHTRWGSADLPVEQVRQLEDRGVTRIVVNLTRGTADEQHARMSDFAERFDLTRG